MDKFFGKSKEIKNEDPLIKIEQLRKKMDLAIDQSFLQLEKRDLAIEKVKRVFEHSANDAIVLGQKYGLTPDEWKEIILSEEVFFKHHDLLTKIHKNISKIPNYLKTENVQAPLENLTNKLNKNIESFDSEDLATLILKKQDSEEYVEIDEYYSEILSRSDKKLSPLENIEKNRYEGTYHEQRAKEYLTQTRPFIEGQYYNAEVLSTVYRAINSTDHAKYLEKLYQEDSQEKSFEEFSEQCQRDQKIQQSLANAFLCDRLSDSETLIELQHRNLLSQKSIEIITNILPDYLAPELAKTRHKKMDLVYSEQRKIVEQPLLKEVQERIQRERGREYSVVLNPDTDNYEIIDQRAEDKKISEKDRILFSQILPAFDAYIRQVEKDQEDYNHFGAELYSLKYSTEYDEMKGKFRKIDPDDNFTERTGIIPIEVFLQEAKKNLSETGYAYLLSNNKSELVNQRSIDYLIREVSSLTEPKDIHKQEFLQELQKIREKKQQEQIREKIIINCEEKRIMYLDYLTDINGTLALLELLNAVHNPNLEKIDGILGDTHTNKRLSVIDELRQEIQSSWKKAKAFSEIIKRFPKEFLSLNRVKKTRAQERIAEQLQHLMIPALYAEMNRKNSEARNPGFFGNSLWTPSTHNNSESLRPQARDYLESQRESIGYMGGNPNEQAGKEQVVCSSRLPLVQTYVSTAFYANEQQGKWAKSYIPFDTKASGASRENTITTAKLRPGTKVQLPLPVHSSYITERVKGISSNGQEIPLSVTLDSFGQAQTSVPEGVEKITYSIQESLIQETPSELSTFEYEKLRKDIEQQKSGEEYFAKVSGLTIQEQLFVKSIEALPVKEKVQAIEGYVRRIGYYDFDNNDAVVGPKRSANSEELFYLMEERMSELKLLHPEKDYQEKRYAGVCDDYSKLTTALLREAGIPSGIMTCFRAGAGATEITVDQAHGTSFVLWRGPRGNITPYVVDGTPSGITEEEQKLQEQLGIQPKTIAEKEQENTEILKEIQKENQEKLNEIEKILETLNPELIGQLDNGKLENALNLVLAHDVNWKHVQALDSILNAYQYSPLNQTRDNINAKTIARDFFESQIRQVQSAGEYASEHSGSAGSRLFDLV